MAKSAVEQLRDAIFLNTADGRDLTRLGRNAAVPRPRFNPADDELFRKLIPLASWAPKMVLSAMHKILTAFFGEPGIAGWNVYQILPNQITVEIPNSLIPGGDLNSATYLQQQLTPIENDTDLTADAAKGASVLTVTATGSSPASGYLSVDSAGSKEILRYGSTTATTYTLVAGELTRKPHASGAPVKTFVLEDAPTSYVGDYFAATPRLASLAAPVAPLDTAFTLTSAIHQLPTRGYIWFEELDPSMRERRFCAVSGVAGTIVDTLNTSFSSGHPIGANVKFFDLLASVNEPSATATGGNPIVLYADSLLRDLKDFLELIKASGVDLKIVRLP